MSSPVAMVTVLWIRDSFDLCDPQVERCINTTDYNVFLIDTSDNTMCLQSFILIE